MGPGTCRLCGLRIGARTDIYCVQTDIYIAQMFYELFLVNL